ncbi:SET domain [Sesbania bispinosa]|nr:SET domain [Sesbania bispinosa]
MVPKTGELSLEVSTNDPVSNDIVAQNPERVETTVQRRTSLRLQNRPKAHYGSDTNTKRPMNDANGDHSDEKRTKFKPSMQQEALAKGENCIRDTWSQTWGCGGTCLVSRGNGHSSSTLVFDELDFRGVLAVKESLRLANLSELQSSEDKQNSSKKIAKDYQEVSKLLNANKVDKNWVVEKHIPGFTVCEYLVKKLKSLAMSSVEKVVCFCEGSISAAPYISPSLVVKDISNGQEAICVPATNEYDNPPVAPPGFTYITSVKVASDVKVPHRPNGCKCQGTCRNTRNCSCAKHNGSEFPYVRGGDRLKEARDVLFECGPKCGCGPDCGNRISQKGLKYRLEVYRTANKGWAVRTWDFIPSGAPVLEYTGVLRRIDELDKLTENEYIFEIDCLQTMNEVEGRERRLRSVSLPTKTSADEPMKNSPEFGIDAESFGNVSRFINHSCEPNLFVQCVLSSHHDISLARVVLFAADDIPPYQELTYDYGYILDSVVGPDGKIKKLPCHCGTDDCRKRLY